MPPAFSHSRHLLAIACLTTSANALALSGLAQSYDIPAQDLNASLIRIASEGGVQLAVPAPVVRGLSAPAIKGRFTPEQALQRALVGHGLEFARTANGTLTVRPSAAVASPGAAQGEPGATLKEVQVTASAEPGSTTEGSGSYASNGRSTVAMPLNLTLRETPQTISVITSQRLGDQALSGIGDALQQTPGITLQNIGGERYSVMSRGYAIDSYQLDGVPTTLDVTTQDVSQSLADLSIYDRVEVLRGASGLMSGAGDPSGTINMVRKRPTADWQAHVSVGAGSWSKARAEVDLSGPLNASGSVRGRLIGAYQKSDSYIDYYQLDKQVLYGVVEADLTDSTLLTAGLSYQKDDPRGGIGNGVGLPLFYSTGAQSDFDRSTSFASRYNRNETAASNAFVALNQRLSEGWSLDFAANQLRQTRAFSWVGGTTWNAMFNQDTGNLPLNAQSGDSEQNQTGVSLKASGPFELFGRKHELAVGYNYADYANDTAYSPKAALGVPGNIYNFQTWAHAGTVADAPHGRTSNTQMRQSGAYAAARLRPSDQLSLILGGRLSRYNSRYDLVYTSGTYGSHESAEKKNVLTPYVGIVYDLDPSHALYASYTTIFKPQSYQDRNGAFLDPREGNSYELGVKSQFADGKIHSSAAAYQIRQDNLAVADSSYTVPGTTNAAYRAEKGARTQGLDLEVNGELSRGWNVAASYTYAKTQDSAGARISTTFPKHLAKLWSTYRLPGQWNALTLGGGVNWQSRSDFTSSPWWSAKPLHGEQGAYAVAGLMVRYDFSEKVSLTININNLFDKQYWSSMDTTFYTGVYGAPRNVMLSLRAAL